MHMAISADSDIHIKICIAIHTYGIVVLMWAIALVVHSTLAGPSGSRLMI